MQFKRRAIITSRADIHFDDQGELARVPEPPANQALGPRSNAGQEAEQTSEGEHRDCKEIGHAELSAI
jgi:hypothetical protein